MTEQNIRQPSPPNLTSILQEQKQDITKSINAVQIGIIKAFDSATQKATIQIALKQITAIDGKGNKTFSEYPLLIDCPVVTLFGGVDFLSMPVTVGDNCVVFFNDREIDNWFVNGGVQAPTTGRVHDISDAIALVGIRPLTNSIATYLANGIRLSHGSDSDIAKIDLTDALISSVATLFLHTGNMNVTGRLDGGTIHAGNGWTGTSDVVTVVDGIVISG